MLGAPAPALGRTLLRAAAAPLAFVLLGLPLVLLLFVAAALAQQSALPSAIALSGGIVPPIMRSLLSGLAALILTNLLAICAAIVAIGPILEGRIWSVRIIALALSLSVTPLLVGPVAFAFLWDDVHLQLFKEILGEHTHSSAGMMLIETLAQTLRYAPLEAWLLVVAALSIDPRRLAYAKLSGFSRRDLVTGELLGPWTLILLVVGAFVFQDASNDVVIGYLALRPSPANGTELAAHMLSRIFAMLSTGASAQAAMSSVVLLCLAIGVLLCICFMAAAMTTPIITRSIVGHAVRWTRSLNASRLESHLMALICLILYLPLLGPLCSHAPEFGELLYNFGPTLLAALVVSVLAWFAASFLIYRLREGAEDGAARYRLGGAGLIAMGVGFFPSIGIALSIYALLFRLPLNGLEIPTWSLAQTIKLLPVVAIFSIPLALGLVDQRLRYAKIAGLPSRTRWWLEFVSSARLAQMAFLLIGWNWILNEAVISSVFQSNLPAFSELALRATSGRAAAYGVASALVTIQIIIFGMLCALWGETSFRSWRRHAQHSL